MQKIRPFFSYYGGKWRDAKRLYPAPRFPRLVEPFAGSAGYALRYADRDVVLVERDAEIAALWWYLIHDATPARILSIPDVPIDGTVDDVPGLSPAERSLVGLWLNRGSAAPCKRPSAWMRSGVRPGSFWGGRVRETIASQLGAIRHWTVIEGSYSDLDTSGAATWFVDPPYQGAGKHYRHGSRGIDFSELELWCRALPGQSIVCEATGADWLPFVPVGETKTTRPGRRSAEAVWLGGCGQQVSLLPLCG